VDNQDELGVSFTAFMLSLATTAAVHFGDIADPSTGQRMEPNLIGAGQMIEIIAMLQEKTEGNLSEPEAKLLEDLLYELRMRFVDAQGGQKRIIIEP
jgi:Domain of unknown function (DUF1844)